ncbi:hypothetical protein PT974_01637 [Cladobotryum mycophilum]|uniref:Uncharacterized protein n=1 Tax=Cladobotryum mycophilum TaxID=491253 RepID=A0ABR0T5D4_9HYPO
MLDPSNGEVKVNWYGSELIGYYSWSGLWEPVVCPSGSTFATWHSTGGCCPQGQSFCSYAIGCSSDVVFYQNGGTAHCPQTDHSELCDSLTVFNSRGAYDAATVIRCFDALRFHEIARTAYRNTFALTTTTPHSTSIQRITVTATPTKGAGAAIRSQIDALCLGATVPLIMFFGIVLF